MLSPENLGRALRRVEANRGAPGVDGMITGELRPWLHEHWAKVREALDAGTYRPSPVRRVVIPKPGAASVCWWCLPAWTGWFSRPSRRCSRRYSTRVFPGRLLGFAPAAPPLR